MDVDQEMEERGFSRRRARLRRHCGCHRCILTAGGNAETAGLSEEEAVGIVLEEEVADTVLEEGAVAAVRVGSGEHTHNTADTAPLDSVVEEKYYALSPAAVASAGLPASQ